MPRPAFHNLLLFLLLSMLSGCLEEREAKRPAAVRVGSAVTTAPDRIPRSDGTSSIAPLGTPRPGPVRPGCGDYRLLVVVESDALGVGLRVRGPRRAVDLVWSLSGPGLAYAAEPPSPRTFDEDGREVFGIEANRAHEPVAASFLLMISGLRPGEPLMLEMGQEEPGPLGTRIAFGNLAGNGEPEPLAEILLREEYRTVELDLCAARPLPALRAEERVLPPRVIAFYYPWWTTPPVGARTPGCRFDAFAWMREVRGRRTIVTGHLPIARDGERVIYRQTRCWRHVRDDHGRSGWVYDAGDPSFFGEQLRLARTHGIDAFAVSVHGDDPEEMGFLERVALPAAARADFHIAALFEAPETGWTYDDREDIARLGTQLRNLVTLLGSRPGALTIDRDGERKVVLFVDVMALRRFPDPQSWDAIRALVDDAGIPYFLWSGPGALPWVFESGFDGVYHDLDVVETLEPPLGLGPYALRDERRLAYRITTLTARERGLAVALPVVPGWEGAPLLRPRDYVAVPRDYGAPGDPGRYYRVRWEDALEPGPDWIVVTSWNEWVEGTEIEPSDAYPPSRFDYLEATRRYACRLPGRTGCAQ